MLFVTAGITSIFQPLIDVFEGLLKFFHDSVGLGWGLSIVAMTIVVRAALIPLTLKQFKSMQALQRLSPEIKKLQARYKDDRQRLNQEMMKFYQENKVNPLGSCLPLVMQLPVFLSLFYMLRKDLKHDICGGPRLDHAIQATKGGIQNVHCDAIAHSSAQFLAIPDLTNKATGGVLIVMMVLYVGSQLLSSLLMSVTADRNQRFLMLGLPFLFVGLIISFPAGLILYWITTNFWTIAQQYVVRKTVGPMRPVEATAGASGGGKADTESQEEKPSLFAAARAAVGAGAPVSTGGDNASDKGADKASGKRDGKGDGKGGGKTTRATAPPSSPRRKKKKRSGRRR